MEYNRTMMCGGAGRCSKAATAYPSLNQKHMIEPKKLSLALAETAGILYAVCAAVVAVSPGFALTLLGWIAHLSNLQELSRQMTLGGFLGGLALIMVYFYLAGWVFAKLYNRTMK